jgi:ribonucleoside-triphosphate reductase
MCCRLRLDLRELRKKMGGFFGSGESTGSVGVVTINLPRIAYLASDEKDFYRRLDHMMDLSARSLKIKRDVITKLLDEGLYPYTKRYLGTFANHFSTIGLIGMNEAGLNAKWLRSDLTHAETQQFAKDVLNHMRERLVKYQEEYGDLYNLEATPAESTTYRLAKHDRDRWPDIITAGKPGDTPYYTNSSHLPVDFTSDIFDALDIQDELQTLYTSGTVFHAFLGERLPNWKAAAALVRKIAENYKLPYYTMSPTYSICQAHGYLDGEQSVCPICGARTEVYSRITGYYRPVQNWNDGKTQEYANRKLYDIEHSSLKRPSAAESQKNPMLYTAAAKEQQNPMYRAGVNVTVNMTTGSVADSTEAKSSQRTAQDTDGAQAKSSQRTAQNTDAAKAAAQSSERTSASVGKGAEIRYLFTTKTCPNCKIAKEMLRDEAYELVDAEENQELVSRFGVMQAPTLIVMNGGKVDKYVNAANIKRFVDREAANQ